MVKTYIAHHGIDGQKWGVRNGPPYPLGYSKHSISEKQAGTKGWAKKVKQQSNTQKQDSTKTNKGLSDKQKFAFKVGTTATLIALAAIGGTYLYKTGKLDDAIFKVDNAIRSFRNRNVNFNDLRFDTGKGLSGFNRVGQSMNTDDALNGSNPFRPKITTIFNRKTSELTNNNCGPTVLAFELRKRGYNVTAVGDNTGTFLHTLAETMNNLKSESFIQPSIPNEVINMPRGIERGKQIESILKSSIKNQYNENARGMILFPGKIYDPIRKKDVVFNHWLSYEKIGDNIKFLNPQNTNINLIEDVFSNYNYQRNNYMTELTAVRLDDVEFNSNVGKYVTNMSKTLKIARSFNPYKLTGKNFISELS